MAKRKTRLEKEQSAIRKLKQQNTTLELKNMELMNEIVKMSEKSKPGINRIKAFNVLFLYIYEIIVSAIILLFVYWISINGYESFDVPYILFLLLVLLISVKCVINNKSFHIKPIFYVILNDLVKPAASMFIGLLLCIFCLGDAWKGAKGYALDVGYTVILVVATTIVVMIIVVVSYLVIGIISLLVKRKGKKR